MTRTVKLTEPLSRDAMDSLMPFHLELDDDGAIRHVGPSLKKLRPGIDLVGMQFYDVFEQRCRDGRVELARLRARVGQMLRLRFCNPPHTILRGQIVEFHGSDAVLVNLALGSSFREAISAYDLNVWDFAPTDPTVEMLFLIEANTTVTREWRNLATRLDMARSEAERDAVTDPLTGLFNRRGFDMALARAAAQEEPFATMVIDLDYFKEVNDTHGHSIGDAMLAQMATLLTEVMREGDTIARIGGDEFAVLLPGVTSQAKLQGISDRLLDQLHEPMTLGHGVDVLISASIGTARHKRLMPEQVADALSVADRALYAAKADGRGRARHAPVIQFPPETKVTEYMRSAR